ncbi:DNA repair exonuclease, partial [Rhizodiscina lignyota]
ADTIRILVSTDNHVGYNERDAIRGDDSWKTFHEIMCLAKERDVDMVLLAGDLFHENKPSRKSMYQVMRSIRMNCMGDKPCELEMLSDASENFQGAFPHANYQDPDMNVGIPIFSIHGNHDDPSGEANLAALDLLQVSGLINYFGRVPEADNISVKPVLLQKGRTKLALYGISNVRDERLWHTFRDKNVKFFQPNVQKDDWFNLLCVHQNHAAHTETSYLAEEMLPQFMKLVIWGHEHECLIEPRYNPEMGFHVMQPGSSVATSLMPGEAVPKHVAVVSITGKEFKCEPIRLKTVRPFVIREMVLSEEHALRDAARKENNRTLVTGHLIETVEEMIKEANQEWKEALEPDDDEDEEEMEPPLPLIRLRVEYTAPDGGKYETENPQRFSNRFMTHVANINDVVQFYRKKTSATRRGKNAPDMPEESVLAEMVESVKIGKIVREFLSAQKLQVLPENIFGDAVSQFIDKDDKEAMQSFVEEHANGAIQVLFDQAAEAEEELRDALEERRKKLEDEFAAGKVKHISKKRKLKPKPDHWDSDIDGSWADDPASTVFDNDGDVAMNDGEEDLADTQPRASSTRGRGRGRGGKATTTTRKTSTAASAAKGSRSKKPVVEDDEDQDDVMLINESDDDVFVQPTKSIAKKPAARAPAKRTASPVKKAPAKSTSSRQTMLNFSQPATQTRQANGSRKKAREPVSHFGLLVSVAPLTVEQSDDEISDDDDAFESAAPPPRTSRARR